jgi:hypothetical protein
VPPDSAVRIGVLFPDILGTYGDNGNAVVLERRLRWRGLAAQIERIGVDDPVPAECDVYVIGGGEDQAQVLAADRLRSNPALSRAVERGAVVLAVCAGLQVLGRWFAGPRGERYEGLGLLDVTTVARRRRIVGDITVLPDPALLPDALTGFENHQGATTLGRDARPLGTVLEGTGNGAGRAVDGAVQRRVLGSYLHGPILARNPALADLLLEWVTGAPLPALHVPDGRNA